MHFLSDAIAEIEGLLEVNRDFCKKQMAEKASPALPTNCAVVPEGLLEVNRKIRKQQMAEKASPTLPTNCAVLPIATRNAYAPSQRPSASSTA